MAITLVNNLYPPVIDSYMPAYIQSASQYRVNISLSQFNTFEDVRLDAAQILITNINNENMINSDTSEYLIKTLEKEDPSNPLNKNCSFTLLASDLIGEILPLNTYYKIQVRLTSAECTEAPTTSNLSEWLSNNSQYFSEWSTVCLISAVTEPIVKLTNLNNLLLPTSKPSSASSYSDNQLVELKLEMSFPQGYVLKKENEKWVIDDQLVDCVEAIKNCSIKLFDDNNKLLLESGSLYPVVDKRLNVVYNTIDYKLKWNFITDKKYYITFKFTTSKLLEKTYYLYAQITEDGAIETQSSFAAIIPTNSIQSSVMGYLNQTNEIFVADEEKGRIKIGINKAQGEYLYLRRSSSETNFTIWEDLKFYNYTAGKTFIEYDTTVKSGVAYKYALQGVIKNNQGNTRKKSVILSCQPMLFDNAFLIADNKVLVIKYNTNVSNFKRNVIEAKIDTIGSKYPFIRRNGHADYKQVTISGMITHLADIENEFATQAEMLTGLLQSADNSKTFYDNYKETYNINDYNDPILEREFREKVSDFLYKDTVKLFKSSQEGNMLLRLMDINLTPEQQLGRNIYSFSCTGYEITDDSIDNYKKHNIYQSEFNE